MKRFFKYIIILFLLAPLIHVHAVSSSDVDFYIKSMYINVDVKNNGDVDVKELITLNGTFNGLDRKIFFNYEDNKKNKLLHNDLNISLYKPSGIKNLKVGIIKTGNNPSFNVINETVNYFKEGNAKNGQSGLYTKKNSKEGLTLKVYNETIDGSTSFYISYTLKDLIVQHNDVSELLYPFIGDETKMSIGKVEIHVNTPTESETLRGYGHGPLYGTVSLDGHKSVIYKVNNLDANTSITGRVVFDKKLVSVVESKMSNKDAEESIIALEKGLEEERNNEIQKIVTIRKIIKCFIIAFYVLVVGVAIFVYVKFDKEYNSRFKEKYNREFTGDYGVETVEYLMNKTVSQNSFNASLLNLIYKKKIKIDKIDALSKFSKDDYRLTKLDDTTLSFGEEKIMNMLFSDGSKQILLSEVQKNAKHTTLTGYNKFLTDYELWRKDAIRESSFHEFYEESKIPLVLGIIILILTMILISFQGIYEVWLPSLAGEITLVLIVFVYCLLVKKRSKKGIEDYAKWKSFKRFLLDFGRMDEKNLPEVLLWDKYLVYATALGVAKKVSKEMKLKFETYGSAYTGHLSDTYYNYLVFNAITDEMNKSFIEAHREVANMQANGNGHGGGFSSGGFSGGGGVGGF